VLSGMAKEFCRVALTSWPASSTGNDFSSTL
jgi:hypothetical protein